MQVINKQVFSAADASLTLTSSVFMNQIFYQGSVQYVFTGSPTGSLVAQISNDDVADASSASNWTAYPTTGTIAISASGNGYIFMTATPFKWFRLKYTPASGTGTLSATVFFQGP